MKRFCLVGALALIGCVRPVLGQGAAPCASSSMLVVQRLTPFITGVVSGNTSRSAEQRSRMQLPVASASQVVLVQDRAICQNASESFARAVLTDTTRFLVPT